MQIIPCEFQLGIMQASTLTQNVSGHVGPVTPCKLSLKIFPGGRNAIHAQQALIRSHMQIIPGEFQLGIVTRLS